MGIGVGRTAGAINPPEPRRGIGLGAAIGCATCWPIA